MSEEYERINHHEQQEDRRMGNTSSSVELAYSSIPVFADDGTLDLEELNFLMGIALKDGKIDDDEKRVLRNIFSQIDKKDVTEKVWKRITEIKDKYGI